MKHAIIINIYITRTGLELFIPTGISELCFIIVVLIFIIIRHFNVDALFNTIMALVHFISENKI